MRLRWAGAAAALVALACGRKDSGTIPSNAGEVTVGYFNAGPQAGALLISITGGPVESVRAVVGQQVEVSWAAGGLGTTRVLVTGRPVTGELLTLMVPDTTVSAAYRARADQVADFTTFALLDPSGNTLIIHR